MSRLIGLGVLTVITLEVLLGTSVVLAITGHVNIANW